VALRAASGTGPNSGFDVVLDLVCGAPLLAALKATRWGARIMTVGTGAGRQIQLDMADLLFRTLSTIGTGQRPPADRQALWRRLLAMDCAQKFVVPYADYQFDDAAAAWAAQVAGPHAKVTARLR
jgi:NADPH:quinone reductase